MLKLEERVGFQPTNRCFANTCLKHLATSPLNTRYFFCDSRLNRSATCPSSGQGGIRTPRIAVYYALFVAVYISKIVPQPC